MIKSFRNKSLAQLFEEGRTAGIDKKMHKRITTRLETIDAAQSKQELNLVGYNFHELHGNPQRYSIHVNGPWCLTFEFENGDASRVDFEQYH